MNEIRLKVAETVTDPPANAPSGCVVVLEPGAKWPEQAFAGVSDREGVAVLPVSPFETTEHFFKRMARQFAHVAANGALVRTVLVACAVGGAVASIDRHELLEQVQNHELFAPNGSVIFVDPTGAA